MLSVGAGPAFADHGVLCGSITAPPGAIHLHPDEPTSTHFQGNNFLIDGNDQNLDGTPGPAAAVAGIATRNDTNTQQSIASLGGSQLDNIQGLGFQVGPPPVPAIQTSVGSPSSEQLATFVDALLTQPHSIFTTTQIDNTNNAAFAGCALGCAAFPRISRFSAAELTIRGNGNIEGYGVMILDGALTVQGNLDFYGLILVRDRLVIEEDDLLGITGNVTVYGSVWTAGLDLIVGGSALLVYSSQALLFADQVAGTSCETSTCGDGVRTYDEECDDGNVAAGDCCSAGCTLEPDGSPCDGDTCTDDACVQGACAAPPVVCGACRACSPGAGCLPAPATDCRQPVPPHRARLALRDDPVDANDKLTWSWRTGELAALADFGDPTANDDYTLCVFSGDGSPTVLLDAVAPAGGLCGDRPCWLPRTNKGFAYRDPLAPGGLAQIRLKAGAGGRAKIRVVGKGEHLGLASLPLPLPISVQLRAGDGTCWEARYSATGVKQDERRFRGLAEAP
jgi:cysteine-rich repeat protein